MAKRTRLKTSSQAQDRVTAYARSVVAGDIIAGSPVRAACQRHLDDLEKDWQYVFDIKQAQRIFDFIEKIIVLTGGSAHEQKFKLLPWQAFVIGSIFGWVHRDTGYRRFKRAYICTGKGSGKTPLVSAAGLYCLIADGEQEAQIFVAAQTADQALVTFQQMCSFVSESDAVDDVVIKYGGEDRPHTLRYPHTNSFIKRIAAEKEGKGKSGFIPHMVVIDEYHEHASSATLDWLAKGTKNRRQPIVFIITNAGAGESSPCALENARAIKVAEGTIDDDKYFSYVCALDVGDKPFEDEECWIKANPSLPLIPGYEYIREQVKGCEGMPGLESVVNRLNFCVWMGSETPWLSNERWREVEVEQLSDWGASPVYIALDLSTRADLTAAVLVCDMGDDTYEAESFMWMPSKTVKQHVRDENIPYDVFAKEGHLLLCEGEFINYVMIAEWIRRKLARHNVQALIYDNWGFDLIYNQLGRLGIELTKDQDKLGQQLVLIGHRQGFQPGAVIEGHGRLGMPESITSLEGCILERRLKMKRNPLMRAAAEGSVVVSDGSDNRRFQKDKSRARIDPIIALTMGVGAAQLFYTGTGSSIKQQWDMLDAEDVPLAWST